MGHMKCTYCNSDKVILVDGEYVCTECGTVVGYEALPPIVTKVQPIKKIKQILMILEKEKREIIKTKYSDIVKYYIAKICRELGSPELEREALELLSTIDKRVWQGKSPRVIAASLVYLAAERLNYHFHKRQIGEIVKVSKFSIRDTVVKLRKYV